MGAFQPVKAEVCLMPCHFRGAIQVTVPRALPSATVSVASRKCQAPVSTAGRPRGGPRGVHLLEVANSAHLQSDLSPSEQSEVLANRRKICQVY